MRDSAGDQVANTVILLYGDTVDGQQGVLLKSFPYASVGYSHMSTSPGTLYYYKMLVKNRRFDASPATVYQARAIQCPDRPVSVPTLSLNYGRGLVLTWPKVVPLTSTSSGYEENAFVTYRLYLNSSYNTVFLEDKSTSSGHLPPNPNGQNDLVVELSGADGNSFNHSGLLMGVHYQYRLAVKNSLCEGPMTDAVTYRVDFNAPGDLDVPVFVPIQGGSALYPSPRLTLQWNTSAHSYRYRFTFQKLQWSYDLTYTP